MENHQLNIKLLETAIGAMQRNRALLFTINLIAALVIVLVYLERFSIDKAQMESYLLAYQGRCVELKSVMEKTPQWSSLSAEDKDQFNECGDIDTISKIILAKINDKDKLKSMSKSLYRLHQNHNDITSVKLGTADVTPLGLGLQVPRNDMYIILGVLLVTLYVWLAFSFNQHARITMKINRMFPDHNLNNKDTQATVSDLVELNFLFRTNEGRATRWAVKTLYWLAPISMALASINNSITDTSEGFRPDFASMVRVPLIAQYVLTGLLLVIGISVDKSDKVANIEPASAAVNNVTPD